MTDLRKLLPCPFCGGDCHTGTVTYSSKTVTEQNLGQDVFHQVNCAKCGTTNRGLVGYKTELLAIAAWNRRAHLAAPAPEPVAYVIFDKEKRVQFATTLKHEAHEHINEAINEHDFEPAKEWIVRPVYALPPLPKEEK